MSLRAVAAQVNCFITHKKGKSKHFFPQRVLSTVVKQKGDLKAVCGRSGSIEKSNHNKAEQSQM